MDEALVIRDFEPRDQPLVRRLVLDGLGERWGTVDESLNPDLDDMGASYAHGRTVVAELAGDIVGTGTLVPRGRSSAEIVRMSIAPELRRRGLGRRVVEELLRTARTWSVTRVVLETSSHWTDVVCFYVACGFEITEEREGDFGLDTWFERRLDHAGLVDPGGDRMAVPQRLSFVTLGVHDLGAMRRFYKTWGWRELESDASDWAGFQVGADTRLALYPHALLAQEAAPGEPPPPPGLWNGVTLAINVATRDEVDALHREALEAGAAPVGPPTDREWGGRSAYVADVEGNRWEIAWAPGFEP